MCIWVCICVLMYPCGMGENKEGGNSSSTYPPLTWYSTLFRTKRPYDLEKNVGLNNTQEKGRKKQETIEYFLFSKKKSWSPESIQFFQKKRPESVMCTESAGTLRAAVICQDLEIRIILRTHEGEEQNQRKV